MLADLAAEVGPDRDGARALLASDDEAEFVRAERQEAYTNGINAVPTFVIEGEWMLRLPAGDSSALIRAEGMLLAAVANAGKGRVALFGEAAMLTAQLWGPERKPGGMNSPEAKYNAQLVLNTLHWLSGLLPAE